LRLDPATPSVLFEFKKTRVKCPSIIANRTLKARLYGLTLPILSIPVTR
jgi:hypothetical protein